MFIDAAAVAVAAIRGSHSSRARLLTLADNPLCEIIPIRFYAFDNFRYALSLDKRAEVCESALERSRGVATRIDGVTWIESSTRVYSSPPFFSASRGWRSVGEEKTARFIYSVRASLRFGKKHFKLVA